MIVGSGRAGGAGLDIALWHPRGERWVRASSAGTPLASSASALVAARGATSDRAGLLVVGSVTLLGDGSSPSARRCGGRRARTAPGRAPTCPATAPWGEAHAAACDPGGRCTVVGEVDGALRGWVVTADGSVSALALPGLAVGEHDLLAAPLLGGGEPTVVLASGGALVVLTIGSDAAGTAGTAGTRQQTGPPARAVRSTARTATGDYVVLEDPAGTAHLVRLTS